jgi:hypothetical protein
MATQKADEFITRQSEGVHKLPVELAQLRHCD